MKMRLYYFIMAVIGILSILAGELEPVKVMHSPGQAIVWTFEQTTVIPQVEFIITNADDYDC